MYYIGNVVKSVAGLYNNLNSATLTGAIDIVVVRQEDGAYVGSPFHVRFGKLGVVSSREKVVEIAVNDNEISLQMKLGPAGEAFFVEETLGTEMIPVYLGTSPIPGAIPKPPDSFEYHDIMDNGFEIPNIEHPKGGTITVGGDDLSSDIKDGLSYNYGDIPEIELSPSKSQSIPIPGARHYEIMDEDDDLEIELCGIDDPRTPYPLSDMDSPISSPLSSSPISEAYYRNMYSDTEAEKVSQKTSSPHVDDAKIKWEWGMLPEGTPSSFVRQASRTRKKSLKTKETTVNEVSKVAPQEEGLLLDEVLAADKEVADMYLNRTMSTEDIQDTHDKEFSQNAAKDDSPIFTSISLPVDQNGELPANSTNSAPSGEQSSENQTSSSDQNNEALVFDDWVPRDVAFSLCGGLKDRKVPPELFLESLVSFEAFCENPAILHDTQLVIRINERYYNWAVAAPYLMAYMVYQQGLKQDCMKQLIRQYMPKKRRGWFQWRAPAEDPDTSDDEAKHDRRRSGSHTHRVSVDNLSDDFDSDVAMNNERFNRRSNTGVSDSFDFKKSLRLTSDQWKSLNLNSGANKVTFTVTTRYQGTASCEARIFLWDYTDKLVISDIDGTITKSDVLGQLLPAVGKDWSQSDVTGLFHKIKHNGYKFIYLSARAIGQAQLTRDFLQSVKQGELTLPDGPVLLAPTSLFKAFKKEVIERKPEEFKIKCLRDIKGLFSKDLNPFYSGFGNRVNDVWAYREVGIPISRVFTINYKGEIKHELTNTFSSSYSKLIELVDQMFPPISPRTVDTSESEFTSFSFWRTPIVELSTLCETSELQFL